MAATKKKATKQTLALHATAENLHVVGIGNLRVVIVHEGKFWYAQGLEIDFAEEGLSLDDVKKKFEDGLEATIDQHLKINGHIEKLLNVAPPEVWKDLLKDPSADKKFYSQISVHEVVKQLPFQGIQYIIEKNVAA